MTLSALSKKIEKVENEISKYQKIISDKKKELAELKKQQHLLQVLLQKRTLQVLWQYVMV